MTQDNKEVEALSGAALALLDNVTAYTMLEIEQQRGGSAREFATWKSQVKRLARDLKEQRAGLERRARVKHVVTADEAPTIERDDNASLAAALIESFERDAGAEALAYEYGFAWKWGGVKWEQIHAATISARLQSWSGLDVLTGHNKEGEPVYKPLKINAIKPTTEMMLDRLSDPTQSDRIEGWLASGQVGLAFEDACFVMSPLGESKVVPHHPDLRTQHVYPMTTASVINGQCPMWERMLRDAFAPLGPEGQADSIRCLQEWCGAAVLGIATRYHRAVVIQGEPGSGKSEVIRVVKALITGINADPDAANVTSDYLCSVDISQWKDDNKAAPFARARLNYSADLSREALKEPGRILTIINGDELTIRPVYDRSFKFAPKTAHMFATNALPQVVAGGEFWDRFILLRMPARIRESDKQIEYYGHVVADAELPGIIAWALAGAARLRDRGRFDLGTLKADILQHWRDEANPVADWASNCLKTTPASWTSTQDLRLTFLDWAKTHGYSDAMSDKTFSQRLGQVGFERQMHHVTRRSGFRVELS
jgi:hypothetical protein